MPFYLHSSTLNIKEIQDSFFKNVILKPIYFKHYEKTLKSICENQNEECYSFEILNLTKNKTYQNSEKIKKSLKSRDNRFILDKSYWQRAQKHLFYQVDNFLHSQFIVLVDLSKQVLILVLWDNTDYIFHPIGFDFISSGNMDKEVEVTNGDDHYLKTPTGLFGIKSGWRSAGKIFDDNITMPYGKKNSFVFYFGTQDSVRYDTFDKNGTKINDKSKWKLITDKLEFAIHAHKSTASFGQPHSHGCIRMSNEMNLFLDNNLVFFKSLYNEKNEWIHPYKKAPIEPNNYNYAGQYMLVLDEI